MHAIWIGYRLHMSSLKSDTDIEHEHENTLERVEKREKVDKSWSDGAARLDTSP